MNKYILYFLVKYGGETLRGRIAAGAFIHCILERDYDNADAMLALLATSNYSTKFKNSFMHKFNSFAEQVYSGNIK